MTAAPPRIRVVRFTPAELLDRLTEALRVYVTAMNYPRSAIRQRAPLWREHASRPGWRGVGALDSDDSLLGLGYGYRGAPGQWWHEEVRRGLIATRSPNIQWLSDYFELTELHVLPAAQGRGLGENLLRLLVADYPTSAVLLSTPELDSRNPARAWRLYRRLGFVDVLRHHCFVGDPRPFAVLGSPLPLADTPPNSPPTRRP